MSKTKCIQKIIAAAGGALTKREAADLLKKFNTVVQGQSIDVRAVALDQTLKQMRGNMVQLNSAAVLHNRLMSYNQKLKTRNLSSQLRQKAEGIAAQAKQTPGQKLANAMQGPGGPVLKALDDVMFGDGGIVPQFEGIRLHFMSFLDARITESGLVPYFKDNDTVMEALEVLFDPNAPGVSDPARKIGHILREAMDLSVARLNESGHYVPHSNRVLLSSRIADSGAVQAKGLAHFKQVVRQTADQSFFQGMEPAEVEDFLEQAYKFISGERHIVATAANFDGVGGLTKDTFKNLAKQGSIRYDIPFKDMTGFKQFWQEFGSSEVTMGQYMMQRMDQIGRSVALNDVLGPVPEATLLDAVRSLEDIMTPNDAQFLTLPHSQWKFTSTAAQAAPPKGWKGVQAYLAESTRPIREFISLPHPLHALYDMDGSTARVIDGTAARMDYSTRALTSMMSLGHGFFMQLTDLPVRGAVLSRWGISGIEGFTQAISGFADALPDAEKAAYFARMGVGTDILRHNMIAQIQGGAGAGRGMAGRIAGAMDLYFKANLMGPTDRLTKQSTATFLANHIATFVADPTSPHFGKSGGVLDSFGIKQADYATLQAATINKNGLQYIDPRLLEQLDPKLHERYVAVIHDTINTATPTPGIRERAITQKGTVRGTWENTTLNVLMMFKSFPILFTTRIVPLVLREETGYGLASMMAGMFVAWYVGDSAKRLALGQDTRRLDDPETWMVGGLRSGLGGLYSDFMMAEYDKHGMDLASSLGGPVIGKLNTFASFGSAAVRGRATRKQGLKTARQMFKPPTTLMLGQQAFDQHILGAIMSVGDPGWMERNMAKVEARRAREESQQNGGF